MDLPWVQSADHLGHQLHESGTMEKDALEKNAQFVRNSVEIREMFGWASPVEILRALKTYCSSFYGSMLWDLEGEGAKQVFNSWGTAVKLAWDCPRQTRTFLMQQVLSCGLSSVKVDILSRFSKFLHSLLGSNSFAVQVMARLVARDLSSTTGSNRRLVQSLSGLDPWLSGPQQLRAGLIKTEQREVPQEDAWRVLYLWSLLYQRMEAKLEPSNEKALELNNLINHLTI